MLSQTVEYALRAMVHLAALDPDHAVSSQAIAGPTRIPKGYLSKIMRDLAIAELVRSQRGPSGGFTLALPPEKISLLAVINAVDPILRITKCPLGNPAHLKLCPLHSRLDHAIEVIEQQFRQTTLAELLAPAPGERAGCRLLQVTKPRR